MIVGIGTDIIAISRIRDSYERQINLPERILTEDELVEFQQIVANKERAFHFLAKRFAAKEAAGKALKTGIGQGVSFKHIKVTHTQAGSPILELTGRAQQLFEQLAGDRSPRTHISLSDDTDYAIAWVILEAV